MITYTKSYKRAADDCGISTTTNSVALTNIQQDVNQGVRIFKNASRRYWTRKEVVTNLVASQQYYTFPADMVRITTVKVTNGGLVLPVTLIDSEKLWNRLNLIPAMTVGIPTQGFVRGRNELGLYPIPSTNTTNGLIVSYEARLKDMSLDDTSATITVTNNSANVTGTGFSANMVGQWLSVTDGSDGNWYQIVGYTSPTQITLENVYQGPSSSNVAAIIGQAADLPEDYHMAPVYYACFNYFMKRKDKDTAGTYKGLFDNMLKDYKSVYAAKTTGLVQQDLNADSYSLFGLPPQNISSQ